MRIATLAVVLGSAITLVSCDSPSGPGDSDPVLRDRIVFRSDRHDVNYDLYSMALDGTAVQRLTSDSSDEHCPSVSPDGRWVAFLEGPDLMLMRPDGTGKSQLETIGDNAEGNCPKWSRDSDAIAVESVPGAAGFFYSLTVMRRDGTTIGKFGTNATTFGFSPSGTELVLGEYSSSGLSADQKITVVSRDGSSRRIIAIGRNPAWSPTGDLIAYVCDNDVTVTPVNTSLCFINPDGTGQRSIQADYSYFLSFSPNGSEVAFSCGEGQLCVASVDGTRMSKSSFQGVSGPAIWTAEGDGLIFSCSSTDPAVTPRYQSEICRVGAGLNGLQYLTRSPASDNSPSTSTVGSP